MGGARMRPVREEPSPMLLRHAVEISSPSATCCITWFGYPPASGQSLLTKGRGSLTSSRAISGSGSSCLSRVSTESLSPGKGGFVVSQANNARAGRITSRARRLAFMQTSRRQGAAHLRGPRPQTRRRRKVVGQGLVDIARLGALTGMQMGQRRDLESAVMPWVARARQRRNLGDDRLGIARFQLMKGGEQRCEIAVERIDGTVLGKRLVCADRSLLVAGPGPQCCFLQSGQGRLPAAGLPGEQGEIVGGARQLVLLRKLQRRCVAHALRALDQQLIFSPTDGRAGSEDDDGGEADDILAVSLPQLGNVIATEFLVDLAEDIAHGAMRTPAGVGCMPGRAISRPPLGTMTSFLQCPRRRGRSTAIGAGKRSGPSDT